jgi:hypothetical protein
MSAMETESLGAMRLQIHEIENRIKMQEMKDQKTKEEEELKKLLSSNLSMKELNDLMEKHKKKVQEKEKQVNQETEARLNNPAIGNPNTEVKQAVESFSSSFKDIGCFLQTIICEVNGFKKQTTQTVKVTVPVEVEVEVPVSGGIGLSSFLNRNRTEKRVEVREEIRTEEQIVDVLLDDTDQVPVNKQQLLNIYETSLCKVVGLYETAYAALIKLDVNGSLMSDMSLMKKELDYYKSLSYAQHDMKRKKAESRGCECEKGFCTRNSKCKCTNGNKIGYCGRNCKCSHGQSFIDLEDEVEGVCLNNKEAQTLLEKEYKKIVEDQVLTPDLEASAKKEAQRKVVLHYKPNYYKDNNAIPQQQA